MCGLVCAWGPNSREIVESGLEKIRHRGPDGTQSIQIKDLCLGFVRLSINDHSEAGMQPYHLGSLWGIFNCEIYNHEKLREKYSLNGISDSDAAVILPLFSQNSREIFNYLDGFVSGVIFDTAQKAVFTLRDKIGKKPLFLVRSGGTHILVSELKSCPKIDDFKEIPFGLCQICMKSGEISKLATSEPISKPPARKLESILRLSVNKRSKSLDNTKFGVFLSGGLDSSIVAALLNDSQSRSLANYYFIDHPKSEDTKFAQELLTYLKIPKNQIKAVSRPSRKDIEGLIDKLVYHTESYNPSIISNGLGSYILSQAARRDGIKFVMTGDGADEVFCGYFDLGPNDDWRGSRKQLLSDLPRTELRRIDAASMAQSIEVRCPFLDYDVCFYADGLGYEDFYDYRANSLMRKRILRETFDAILPPNISNRKKMSFDVGSALQELMINHCVANNQTEKEYLETVWRRHFQVTLGEFANDPYFHEYPAFDKYIKTRGKKYL